MKSTEFDDLDESTKSNFFDWMNMLSGEHKDETPFDVEIGDKIFKGCTIKRQNLFPSSGTTELSIELDFDYWYDWEEQKKIIRNNKLDRIL
jgi:hypothetical protein